MKFYYKDMFLEVFDEIINGYSLEYNDIGENEAILLSKSYGFSIAIFHGEIFLEYINQKSENEFEVYDICNYCMSQFDENDRKGFLKEDFVEKYIQVSLIILARGLKNHFSHILEGDKEWLKDYSLYELADEPRPLDEDIKQIILGL